MTKACAVLRALGPSMIEIVCDCSVKYHHRVYFGRVISNVKPSGPSQPTPAPSAEERNPSAGAPCTDVFPCCKSLLAQVASDIQLDHAQVISGT